MPAQESFSQYLEEQLCLEQGSHSWLQITPSDAGESPCILTNLGTGVTQVDPML